MGKILFDGTYYQGGSRFHGGGEYGNAVLFSLLESGASNGCGLFYREKYGLDSDILDRVKGAGWNIHPMDMMRELPAIVREHGYTIIYSPLPYGNNWYWFKGVNNVRFIGTFHGLRTMELGFYEDCDRVFFERGHNAVLPSSQRSGLEETKRCYEQALKSFSDIRIVTDSEHSRNSILHYFPEIESDNIMVFYPPEKRIEKGLEVDRSVFEKLKIEPDKFALMTSANIWYKNPKRAVMAFDMVFSGKYKFIPKEYKFLLIGDRQEENNILSGVHNRDRFVFSDYLAADELESLYQKAHLFVYPTLNEGFGYPPLEAMKYETLCMCSVNTSVSEVCRDMVWYFNPLDVDEMAIRILQTFSETEREKKRKRIRELMPGIQQRQRDDLTALVRLIMGNDG
ncbi:MAG: glycosyltransferase [Lachnospiraceae bacterium]|nr:glycosyltransferase [Lachnospiraceae bacterium]